MPIRPVRRPVVEPTINRPDIQPRARVRIVSAPEPARTVSASTGAPVDTGSYKVGYKKPPMHTRFRKGQSGNPKGRPKGAKSLKTIMRELLTARMTVRTAEGTKRISRIEGAAHKMMEAAFAGNVRALQAMLAFYQTAVGDEIPPAVAATSSSAAPPPFDPDEHDRAILAALREQFLIEIQAQP